jgi:HEAT repeat protein
MMVAGNHGGKGSRENLRLTLGSDRQRASPRRNNASDKHIEGLIGLIGNEQFSIRMAATRKLSAQGADAVPALLKALQNGLWYTRECAVQALGDIGIPQVIQPLIGSLRDENVGVRQAAARALSNMIEKEGLADIAQAIAEIDVGTHKGVLEAIRSVSPLAGRKLDEVLAKLLGPSRKEQVRAQDKQIPPEESSSPSPTGREDRSLWKRLRRFLETWI